MIQRKRSGARDPEQVIRSKDEAPARERRPSAPEQPLQRNAPATLLRAFDRQPPQAGWREEAARARPARFW